MNYYIEYPLQLDCNLQCDYCFHRDYFDKKGPHAWKHPIQFTVEDFLDWKDKNLQDAEDIVINFTGGESFLSSNVDIMIEVLSKWDGFKLETLSNGLPDHSQYARLLPFKDRIKRIGFTYHRKHMDEYKTNQFIYNVLRLRDLGIEVYVKELLFLDEKDKMLEWRAWWKKTGVAYKIQDFKGVKGMDQTEATKYSTDDMILVDPEYRHLKDRYCHCRPDYMQILIAGYDEYSGLIYACWKDNKVIGSIQQRTLNKNANVDRQPGTSIRNVIDVPVVYPNYNMYRHEVNGKIVLKKCNLTITLEGFNGE